MTTDLDAPIPSAGSGRLLHRLAGGDADTVAYPQSTWTSFDRYDRYAEIAGLVRSALGPGHHRVLDVGDTAGYLALFEPDLWVVGLDMQLEAKRLGSARPLLGDGARLPFPDGTFDAVVSSDVLEHVPAERRPAFLAELARVSRDLVVVAAPFATVGVAGVEDIVRRYALLANGEPQPQLEEHAAYGLPDVDETHRVLTADGSHGAIVGNGNLYDWLVSMLLRFQLEARPALSPLSEGFDVFHNSAALGTRHAPPFYRHVVVRWRDHAPDLVPVDHVATTVDLMPLAAAIVAADSTEVVRQDVNGMIANQVLPPVAAVDAGITALHTRLDGLTEFLLTFPGRFDKLAERIDRLDGELEHLNGRNADTRARLEELFETQMQVNAPLLRAKGIAVRIRNRLRPRRG